MPVVVEDLLSQGGSETIAFLQFALCSARPEPIFVYLARDYRFKPTLAGARALFELFCDTNAPARLDIESALPPRDLSLSSSINQIRRAHEATQLPPPVDAEGKPLRRPGPPAIPNYLFRTLEDRLLTDPEGAIARLAAIYDPQRGVYENLPGGKINPGQRHFVENIWVKRVRPALTTAGFWRVANLGLPS